MLTARRSCQVPARAGFAWQVPPAQRVKPAAKFRSFRQAARYYTQ
jgi:hypothetical protein